MNRPRATEPQHQATLAARVTRILLQDLAVQQGLLDFAVVGTFGEIVELMHKRCAGLASSTEFSIPVTSKTEYERLVGLIKTLQQG